MVFGLWYLAIPIFSGLITGPVVGCKHDAIRVWPYAASNMLKQCVAILTAPSVILVAVRKGLILQVLEFQMHFERCTFKNFSRRNFLREYDGILNSSNGFNPN